MKTLVKIFVQRGCPYCHRAVEILEQLPCQLEVIDVTLDRARRREVSESVGGWSTVPMIFIGDRFIGGCDDLEALRGKGKLAGMLA